MASTTSAQLMPPPFEDGLAVYSSGDGTPGSATYDGAANAALVTGDQDFGSCLEMQKTQAVQKLRYMGETPLLPGCYLKISARVKAVSGNLPNVRVAGWAGGSGGAHVTGLTEVATATTLDTYGKVVTVEAIVGSGARTGVELAWGIETLYGHFGLDLTGPDGGLVRIDDLIVEDVTQSFLREMMDIVDVRDYGARGDGTTDDSAAFEAADLAAAGRTVLVSDGVFRLESSVTFDSRVRFQGTLSMPDSAVLSLTRNFDLPAYIDAFGSEQLAFRKAFQALLNFSDHESLDLGGRRIDVDGPIDMQAAVNDKTSWAIRRVIRNGQLNAVAGSGWTPDQVVAQASYATSANTTLSNVSNVAGIAVGSLVEGAGVGREVYVRDRNVAAGTLTLSQPLHAAAGTQSYTFTRFKYMLDFTGFEYLAKFSIEDVEFQLDGKASGIALARDGVTFHLRDCFITKPADRGITSIGRGCQGMLIDQCNMISSEQALRVQDRRTVAMNTNANDVKVRDSRIVKFKHFAVMNGGSHLFVGNHWFQGDDESGGTRTAGLVLTQPNCSTVITGNYIDNNAIEWTNEHDSAPEHSAEFSFGALTLTGNNFYSLNSGSWFRWLIIKPHGGGHYIHGLTIRGNTFKAINGNLDRPEMVDESIATLDRSRFRNIVVEANTFNGIDQIIGNPTIQYHEQNTASDAWTVDFSGYLPFDGSARTVQSVVRHNSFRDAGGGRVFPGWDVNTQQGANGDQVRVNWSQPVTGKVWVTARCDNPN
ncbi:pectate lyase-like protein [Brevirhabdus pacifica]|nr:glycosyl hydrolase family 28-related protein [Brevirhabdus pacifica]PJJ86294.1 pectate lyase-like protein [Brevirhabdus pacifica]